MGHTNGLEKIEKTISHLQHLPGVDNKVPRSLGHMMQGREGPDVASDLVGGGLALERGSAGGG
jgi:hypothetical protein